MRQISSIVSEAWLPNGSIKSMVSVTIIDSNNKYVLSKYDGEHGEFLTSRPNPRFTLRLQLNNQPWTQRNQININARYFAEFKRTLREFYTHIRNCDSYLYNDEGYLYDIIRNNKDVVRFKTIYQVFILEPEVLSVSKDLLIPGVRMTFNEPENTAVISVDEFEAFISDIVTLNLYSAGMMTVLSHYTSSEIAGETIMKNMDSREVPKTNNEANAKNIFARNEQQETVSGTIIPDKPTSIFDL